MAYVDWEFAKTTGRTLVPAGPSVTRAEAEAEVAAIRAAAATARQPVAETARMDTPGDAPQALVVDRATWIAVNADSMSAMLDPMVPRPMKPTLIDTSSQHGSRILQRTWGLPSLHTEKKKACRWICAIRSTN